MADTYSFIYAGEEMPRYCAAPMCTNSSLNGDPALHLFKFPLKNKALLEDWMVNIQRDQFHPNENSYLCSEHFEASDIIHTFGRTTLKANAVPSLFKFNIMPTCYVPGCKSGYVVNGKVDNDRHFFSPPKNLEKLENWNKAIQRTDKQLDYNCRVCDLHFEDYFIEKYYTLQSNGEIKKHEPGKWTLHPDAVPTIFHDRPKHKLSIADHPKQLSLIADYPKQISLIADCPKQLPLIADCPKQLSLIADCPKQISLIADYPKQKTLIADKRIVQKPHCLPSVEKASMEINYDEYSVVTGSTDREASALQELLEDRLAAAKEKDIDASLMKLEFGNKRIEWVYRGSGKHAYSDKLCVREEIQPRKKICLTSVNNENNRNNRFKLIDMQIPVYQIDDNSTRIFQKQKAVPFQIVKGFHHPQRARKHTGGAPLSNRNKNKNETSLIPKAKKRFQKEKTASCSLIRKIKHHSQLAKKQTGSKLCKTALSANVKLCTTTNSINEHLKKASKSEPKSPQLPQVARKHTGGTVLNKVTEFSGLAKKSTVSGLLAQMKIVRENNVIQLEDKDEKDERKRILSNLLRNSKPTHKCGRNCSRIKDDDPVKFRGKNPLQIPRLCGWKRHVEKKVVVYAAPCGKMFKAIDEISRYLWTVKSKLTIDLFCFDSEVYMANEYVPKQVLAYIPDITFGKENVLVSCVNSISNEYPPDIGYSTVRYPGKGVNLNLDPEFLCGCDCKDNCQNSRRCQCQQLTINATEALPSGKIPNAGYKYRRLIEPLITGIYECNSRCKCGPSCMNRVAQNGLQVRLQLFQTGRKGWGIRCLDDIPQGMFICTYAGELLTEQGASEKDGRQLLDDYLAELDHIEVVEKIKEGYESDVVESEVELETENKQNDVKTIPQKLASFEDSKLDSTVSSFDIKQDCDVLSSSSIKTEICQQDVVTPSMKEENSQQNNIDLSSICTQLPSIDVTSAPTLGLNVLQIMTERSTVSTSNPNQDSVAVIKSDIQNMVEDVINMPSPTQDPTSNAAIAESPQIIYDCSYNNNSVSSSAIVENNVNSIADAPPLVHLENNLQSNNEKFSNVESFNPVLITTSVPVENDHELITENSSSIHLLSSIQTASPLTAEPITFGASEGTFITGCLDSHETSSTFVESDNCDNDKGSFSTRSLSQDSAPLLENAECESQDITDNCLNVQLCNQALIGSPKHSIVESAPQEITENSISVVHMNQVQAPLLTAVENSANISNLESSSVHSFNASENNTALAENCLHNTSTDSFNIQTLSEEQILLKQLDNTSQDTAEDALMTKTSSPIVASSLLGESAIDSTTEESFSIHQLSPAQISSVIKLENSEESFDVHTSSHDATLLIHTTNNSQCETEKSLSSESINLALVSSEVCAERSLHDVIKNSHSTCELNLTQATPNTEISLCDAADESSSVQTFTPSVSTTSLIETGHHNLIEDSSVIIKALKQETTTTALLGECDSQVTTKHFLNVQPINPSFISLSMLVESALQGENEDSPDIQSTDLSQIPSLVPIENSFCHTSEPTSFEVENLTSHVSVNSENTSPVQTQNNLSETSVRQDLISSITNIESTFQKTTNSLLTSEKPISVQDVSVQIENGLSCSEDAVFNVHLTNSLAVTLPVSAKNCIQSASEESSNIQPLHSVVIPNEENKGAVLQDNDIDCLPVSKPRISKAKKSTKALPLRLSKRNKRNTGSDSSFHYCFCNNSKERKKPKGKSHAMSVRRYFNEQYCYLMNAVNCGNIGRYLNHSCNPNCFVQNVFVDTHDLRFPWVAFFAMKHLSAGSELTWDYNYIVGSVPGKILYCHCGSANCRGRLI